MGIKIISCEYNDPITTVIIEDTIRKNPICWQKLRAKGQSFRNSVDEHNPQVGYEFALYRARKKLKEIINQCRIS